MTDPKESRPVWGPGARSWLSGLLIVAAGGLVWVGRQSPTQYSVAPLSPVGPNQALPARLHQPPPHPRWRSPLLSRCNRLDSALRARLLQQLDILRAHQPTVAIHPTNFGERFRRDAQGRALQPFPSLIVLHETVYGIGSAINTFVTPHPRDEDQVSYHALIGQDGTVVKVLDPDKRAFGAGNSAFNGQWVVTNPAVGGSVNNFALHVSLETPLDGEDAEPGHSGYTQAQYDALAVLLSQWMRRYGIPFTRITTHAHVDLGGERSDPRSFDWQALQDRLQALGLVCGRPHGRLFRSPVS